MKSFHTIGAKPTTLRVSAEEMVELHAAHMLLLFHLCGTAGSVESLTKMAKLDFLVRYPTFFTNLCQALNIPQTEPAPTASQGAESAMSRCHYGPWDERYYQVLAYLEGRRLLQISKKGAAFVLTLTKAGKQLANQLAQEEVFADVVTQMRQVKKVLGQRSGDWLKKMIFQIFTQEVAQLSLGEQIR